jgi:lipopolysaccharide/colanic/teichoic acid biosynthesis glycosyltransferase
MINFLNLKISNWALVLCLGDIIAYCLAIFVGIFVSANSVPFFLHLYGPQLSMVGLTYITVLYISNLYDHYQDFRRRENLSRVILSCLAGSLVVIILFCHPSRKLMPLDFIEWHAVAFVWLTTLWRYAFSAIALPVRLQRRVLVVGTGQAGRWITKVLQDRPNSGLIVSGFVDDGNPEAEAVVDGLPVFGTSSRLEEIIREQRISLAVVAVTHERPSSTLMALNQAFMGGCQLADVPSLYEFLTGKIPIDYISDIWIYFNNLNFRKSYYPRAKVIIDTALATLGLLLTWPLFIIIVLAIKLDTPGTVFFRQKRLGLNGKPFEILKFRTMLSKGEEAKPMWASRHDPRVTRVGFFLRQVHLDEMAQLIKIFKGNNSLIGPRAEWDVFARQSQELVAEWRPGRRTSDPPGFKVLTKYREQIPYYSYRLLVKPGVTGWAQVMFPYAGSSLEEMKEKLEYDLFYIKNIGFFLDLAILMKTIRIVLLGHGK